MTIVSTVSRNDYTGSNITGPYAYTFRINQASDLAVITADANGAQTTLAYPGGYTVAGVGQRGGGTITLATALPTGSVMTIKRALALTQPRSIRNQGAYFAPTVEDALDDAVAMIQDVQDQVNRAIKVPDTIPASGANAQILNFTPSSYLRVNASGTGLEGVSSVIASQNFLQAGAGAVTRTMQAKAADRVSVRDFGALGNGVTDDAAAIRTALAALVSVGGGTLWFDPGTYLIGSRISVVGVSNVTFHGAGRGVTVLKASGSRTSIFTTFPEPDAPPAWTNPPVAFVASNLTFRGLTFDMAYGTVADGGVANPAYGTLPYRYAADNYQYPIILLYVDGVVIADCEFRNCWYNGVEIYTCNDVWVTDNLFNHCGDVSNYLGFYSGAEIDGFSHRVRVLRNTFRNVGWGVSINAANQNESPDGLGGTSDIWIDDNALDTAVWGMCQADGYIRRMSISNNHGRANQRVLLIVSFNEMGTNNCYGPRGVIVRGNHFADIALDGATGRVYLDVTAGEFDISDNTFSNTLGASANVHYGILARAMSETIATVVIPRPGGRITKNDVRGSFSSAYGVASNADYTIMNDNIVQDTSGTMLAAVTNVGAHSPSPTGTLVIP